MNLPRRGASLTRCTSTLLLLPPSPVLTALKKRDMAAHLCPPSAQGLNAKPCRTISALAGRAYSAPGQAGSALHTMAVLPAFQAKLLHGLDESGPKLDAFKELRIVIGKAMASLVVLERHLWLDLMEIKDADKVTFLYFPVSPTGLFGPAVNHFAECFTAAQKLLQAMRHFLPKCSSSASVSGHQKTPSSQQHVKPMLSPSQPQANQSLGSNSALRQLNTTSFLNARDPASEWRWTLSYPDLDAERKRRGPGPTEAGTPSKKSHAHSPVHRLAPGDGSFVHAGPILPTQHMPEQITAVIVDPHTQRALLLFTIPRMSAPCLSPGTCHSENWVLQIIEPGYLLQFARSPSCFRCIIQTSV